MAARLSCIFKLDYEVSWGLATPLYIGATGKPMDFELSPKVKDLQRQISDFMNEYVYPIEKKVEEEMSQPGREHTEPQVLKDVRKKAKAGGLWNLFLPDAEDGKGLKVAEYAPLCAVSYPHLTLPTNYSV